MISKKSAKKIAKKPDKLSETYRRIYAMVKKVPRGKVASYGQIARLCGMERHARLVGYALHALRDDDVHKVPWQRVINAQGYISLRDPPYAASLQKKFLESEGIVFDDKEKVDLKKFGWKR